MQQPGEDSKGPNARGMILWLTMALLAILTVLSAYSAFLGAARATVFFNSIPLVAFWFILTAVFIAGFFMVKGLRKRPGLLLSHLGCVLVLLGALWGSKTAHKLRTKYFKATRIREGVMQIHEGQSSNKIYEDGGDYGVLGKLPFSVALDDFWIEYYESPGSLQVTGPDGQTAEVRSEEGKTVSLAGDVSEVKILRAFENFKIFMDGGERRVADEKGKGVNPALEIEITASDGAKSKRYVFANSGHDHGFSYEGLKVVYNYAGSAGIKDFKSSLAIIEDGEPIVRKIIEVNKPLHYGGYSFYQSSYDQKNGHYTVLSVVSSSGLLLVFPGYALLCIGVIWQCWLRHIKRREVKAS